jgi:hypothetical protein
MKIFRSDRDAGALARQRYVRNLKFNFCKMCKTEFPFSPREAEEAIKKATTSATGAAVELAKDA